MRPHELTPLTVYDDALALPPPLARTRGADATHALHVGDLLAEPPTRSGEWSPGCVRRLVAASTGPVAVGVRRADYRARLEAAGWFCAAEDADLVQAREACWPGLARLRRLNLGFGNPRPALVLVGEKVNHAKQLPFASRSGTWLFLALRLLGHDELTLYLANACSLRGRRRTKQLAQLHRHFDASSPTWVALGATAHEVLTAAQVPHAHVCHPSHHKRFKHHEDVIGYAQRLRAAGVPDGPWTSVAGPTLPVRDVPSLPELPAPYDLRSVAFVKGTSSAGEGRKGTRDRGISPAKREGARQAYVTGNAPTLKDAAEMYGINPSRLREYARDHGWAAEREEQLRHTTEVVKAAAADTTAAYVAKSLTDSLKLSWGGLRQGLASVARRLKDGSLEPTPQQVEALSRVALALRAASQGTVDPTLEALVQEPLAELAQRCIDQLDKGLGGA